MRYIFAVAGVPREIYDLVYKSQRQFAGTDQVIMRTFVGSTYSSDDAHFFLREFATTLDKDSQNSLKDTGFALFYVGSHELGDEFSTAFFPSVLTISLDWKLEGYNRTSYGRSANELIRLLQSAAQKARRWIPQFARELTQNDNRTPLLLPVGNFRSKVLRVEFERLAMAVETSQTPSDAIQRTVREVERAHPRQKMASQRRSCFVDDARIEFHPPGQARHAFARLDFKTHPASCAVAGRRRFGAPYDRAFHFDCKKGDGQLRARLCSCHESHANRRGDPHINIAPNDFLRGHKQ